MLGVCKGAAFIPYMKAVIRAGMAISSFFNHAFPTDSYWLSLRKAIGRDRLRPPLSRQRPGRKWPSGGHRVNGAEVGSQYPVPVILPGWATQNLTTYEPPDWTS